MTQQLIKYAAAVMTTLLALLVFWQFRIVVVYVLISLTLAAALRPWVNRLVGRGLVVQAAWILVYLAALGSFGLLLFLSGDWAIREVQDLIGSLAEQDAWSLPGWLETGAFQQALGARLPAPSQIFAAVTGDQGQLVLPAILGFTQGMGSIVSGFLVMLLLSVYWSVNQAHFERLWLSLLPSGQRKQAREIWRTVEHEVGAYQRGELIQSLLAGLLLGLGYWLLGSPFPAFLALTGALASLIPVIGIGLAILPVLLVGLLTSVQLSLFTALYALAVWIGLGVWVKPRLFKRRWDNPILTVVLLIALADAFGLVGIIVAPLFSVVCQILWNRLVSRRMVAGAAAQISDLRQRQTDVLAMIMTMQGPSPVLVTSSMQRLADLIEQAEPILRAAVPADASELFPLPQPVSANGGPPESTNL